MGSNEEETHAGRIAVVRKKGPSDPVGRVALLQVSKAEYSKLQSAIEKVLYTSEVHSERMLCIHGIYVDA